MIKAKENESLQEQLAKFKSDPVIFETLLHKQKRMPNIYPEMETLIFGNQNAPHTITLVTNPLCNPCSKKHLEIEHLIAKTDKIKVQLVFMTNRDPEDIASIVVSKIYQLPQEKQHEAVKLWYERNDKNLDAWLKDIDQNNDIVFAKEWIEKQWEWSEQAQIKGTPTLFFDGYALPDLYRSEENLEKAIKFYIKSDLYNEEPV